MAGFVSLIFRSRTWGKQQGVQSGAAMDANEALQVFVLVPLMLFRFCGCGIGAHSGLCGGAMDALQALCLCHCGPSGLLVARHGTARDGVAREPKRCADVPQVVVFGPRQRCLENQVGYGQFGLWPQRECKKEKGGKLTAAFRQLFGQLFGRLFGSTARALVGCHWGK